MDEIKRKLNQIDKRLAGVPTHEHIFGTSPLLFLAVGLVSGIAIQHYLNSPIFIWSFVLFFSALTAVVLFILKSGGDTSRYVTAYMALVCFLCLGAIRLTSFNLPKAGDIRNFVSDEPVMATVRGFVTTQPRVNKYPDWKFAQFMPTDPGSSFYMKLTEVEANPGWTKAAGTIRASVDEPVLDLSPGDYVQAYCWLDVFKHPTNPGQFDTADFLANNNVYIGASIKSRQAIKVINKSTSQSFTLIRTKIRELAETALQGDLSREASSSALLQALLLGYRGDIDRDTYQAFRKTGLLHFISLSGLHIGILIAIVWWICQAAGLMKEKRALVCMLTIATFLMIVPARSPTLRAAIITLMFCLSFFFRRKANSINSLSLAAIILLLVRPTQLFEAGWQLSFASVLGIILFTKKIEYVLREKIGDITRKKQSSQENTGYSSLKFLAGKAVTLFSVGLAAWIASAGILLYHFHTITPLASLWTVLVFPLVAAILTLGFLKMVMFFILPTLSLGLGFLVTRLSALLILIVKLIAHLGISQILIGHIPSGLVLFYYCFIGLSILAYYSQSSFKRKLVIAAVPVIILFPGMIKWQRTHNDNLVLTCLDTGHGQAIFLQLPGGDNLLFDAGSMYRSNIGSRIVTPFMDYSGINTVNSVIISHNDIDHINGIPEIVNYCNVGAVYANDDFFNRTDEWGTASFLSECLSQMGTEIERLSEQTFSANKANIKILWPEFSPLVARGSPLEYSSHESRDPSHGLSDNDKSLVTMIEFAGKKILLCSDIEQFAQRELMHLYPDLRADIVVVPHHGSTNTLEKNFLDSLDADILICSTDKTPAIQDSKQLFYTSRDGAITISIDTQGKIKIKTYNEKVKK